MSEAPLAAAAAALGMPEDLVRRSAEARAAEAGSSVDEILAAWAGGEAITAAPPAAPEPPPSVEASSEPPAQQADVAPEIVVDIPPAQPAPNAAEPVGVYQPPVLVGARDKPGTIILGAIVLFLAVFMMGLVGPSLARDEPGARTSEIPYSQAAVDGQQIYASLGCASCHTQMVRPVVADVGLGAVTLNDTNQVMGDRRFGPDLSDIGTRMTVSQLEAIIAGGGGHAPHRLADADMDALVAYLSESRNSGG
ncbi:MAG: cbb3-type cytochrome c oxidase subunit II [Acidimicrobiia bacterium]